MPEHGALRRGRGATTVSLASAVLFRQKRSGLLGGLDSPESVAHALLGLQAQDLAAAGLSVSARCPTVTHLDISDRLYRRRSLVKLWAQRNTLHLYPSRDWPTVFVGFGADETPFERAITKRGVDLATFRRRLDAFIEGSRHRDSFGYDDLKAADLRLAELDLSGWSAGWGDLCLTIERRAPVCHVETVAGSSRFAHHDRWLPDNKWQSVAPEEAEAAIVRRYLATYGPATAEDLSYWAGISLVKARSWLATCERDVDQVEINGAVMWLLTADLDGLIGQRQALEPCVRLLGKYEPLLLAHKKKDWLIDPERRTAVWRSGGRVEAVVLCDGRIRGTWRYRRHHRVIDLKIALFDPPREWLVSALDEEVRRIGVYFGLEPRHITITTEDSP